MIQEAKFNAAMFDLNKAQAQLDEKQRELDAVQAMYDAAMSEKQVRAARTTSRSHNRRKRRARPAELRWVKPAGLVKVQN